MSMSHNKREIVPDRGTSERKSGAILDISCVCLEYEICDYRQQSGECVMGCTVQEGQKGKEEQCK